MENASKALLIAAAVLIAIILIALGIKLIGRTSDTTKQSEKVGKEISLATDEAVRKVQKNFITAEEFNDFVSYFKNENRSSNEFKDIITNIQNKKIRNQIQIIGYVYCGEENYNDVKDGFGGEIKFQDEFNQYINGLKQDGKLINVEGLPKSHKEYYLNVYAKKIGYSDYNSLDIGLKNKIEEAYTKDRNNKSVTGWGTWAWSKDNDGYIDKCYYIAYLIFEKTWVKPNINN